MSYLLDVILCSGVVIGEIFWAIVIGLFIQGIVYRTTGFSIYGFAKKNLILDQLKK